LQLLYLDSYYFYAPVPRVVILKDKLSRYNLRKYKFLYGGFAGSRYFVQHFTQTLCGEAISSIPSLYVWQRKPKPSKGFQKFLDSLKEVFGGRVPEKRIRLEKLIEIVGPEKANMIDFIVFILRNAYAEDRISRGYCYSEYIEIDRDTAKALYNICEIEFLIRLLKRHTSLYKLYESYSLCKTCWILGLKYPHDVVPIREVETSAISTAEVLCDDCREACSGKHVDDVEKAKALLLYAKGDPSTKIYVATVASVTKPEKFSQECFSCLAKCIEKKTDNIEVLQ